MEQLGLPISRDPSTAFKSPLMGIISDIRDREQFYTSLRRWRECRTKMVSLVRQRSSDGKIEGMGDQLHPADAKTIIEELENVIDLYNTAGIRVLLKELTLRLGFKQDMMLTADNRGA